MINWLYELAVVVPKAAIVFVALNPKTGVVLVTVLPLMVVKSPVERVVAPIVVPLIVPPVIATALAAWVAIVPRPSAVLAAEAVVEPVPPLAIANVPASVIVPEPVTGPPEVVNPVVPPDTSIDVTVPEPAIFCQVGADAPLDVNT